MRRRAIVPALLLLAICGAAFVLRTTHAPEVFTGDGVVFAENDPYYHMRRVFQVLADFPRVPAFDRWLDHPVGAPVVFAPLFDLGIAALAKALGLAGDRRAVETMAALVPPLLGALTCLPTYGLAFLTTSRPAALLAAGILALVPAHIWYSRLGFVDHHVAVTLLDVAMCAFALRALGIGRRNRTARVASSVEPRFAGLAIATLAAGVLTWNGFLLLLAVFDAALLALFAAGDAAERRTLARFACALHAGAALLVVPGVLDVVRGTGAPLSTRTLSWLHVAILLVAAAASGVLALVGTRHLPARRAAALAGLLGLLVAAGLATQHRAVAEVVHWVFAWDDPFMGSVQGAIPLLRGPDGGLDLVGPQVWMTRFFLAVPLLLVALAVRLARGSAVDRGRLFLLPWTALLVGLALLQRRFAETAAPAMSVLVADALVEGARAERRVAEARGTGERPARVAAAAAVAGLVALAVAPYHAGFVAEPARLAALWRAPIRPGGPDRSSDADRAERDSSSDVRLVRTLGRFGDLLRREALAAPGAERAGADPAGAMNSWALGHKLLYVAGVPVTASPFGSHGGGASFADTADFLLAQDEATGLEILGRRGNRWVVVDDQLGTIGASILGRGGNPRDWYDRRATPDGMVYDYRPPLLHSLWFRLTRLAGAQADVNSADGVAEVLPALGHFRLVVDSEGDGDPGFVQVWEVVPGARLVVQATPGTRVGVRHAFTSDAGRSRVHSATALADDTGRARFVLPYSSERPDLGQSSNWEVEIGSLRREVHVAEGDVREGRTLEIPAS